jgi:hypothetical protein
MKTANEAEAKHTLQYFPVRQKIPPVTKNGTLTITNSMVGTAETGIEEKVVTNPRRRIIRLRRSNTPNITNIMPAAILILIVYLTSPSPLALPKQLLEKVPER